MGRTKVLKRSDMKDSDWIFLHRESGGYGSPRVEGGSKRFAMTARDFLADIPTSPIAKTDCPNSGVENILMRPVAFEAGQPAVGDPNRIVTITPMIVGAYTIAAGTPLGGIALNVTITLTRQTGVDTLGTVLITGTDIDDQVLTETITPVDNTIVQGTRAFKTVVSAVGAGWATEGDDDDIEIGFGELIGLPDYMTHDRLLFAMFNNVREGTHPTVTSSNTVLALNTADLSTALDGSVVVIYYLV